jgi:hypothetical protein
MLFYSHLFGFFNDITNLPRYITQWQGRLRMPKCILPAPHQLNMAIYAYIAVGAGGRRKCVL